MPALRVSLKKSKTASYLYPVATFNRCDLYHNDFQYLRLVYESNFVDYFPRSRFLGILLFWNTFVLKYFGTFILEILHLHHVSTK